MSAALHLESVSLAFGDKHALRDFSLEVGAGEVVALLGPSGCGKTSVLRVALGLATPQAGSIWIGDRLASSAGRLSVPPERRRLSMVFQDLALWPHMSVEAHLRFVLDSIGVPRSEQENRIAAMLDGVGLIDRREAHPAQLSGGERQRVAIARALVINPLAVLLDEPLANLDLARKRETLALLRGLLGRGRLTGLYVTHDVREAVTLADRLAVMERGELVAIGALDELRRSTEQLVRDALAGLEWNGE